jgi:hypothetical protein
VSTYFTIQMRTMWRKSSVYAGSSLNTRFDAANGAKEAWLFCNSTGSQGPGFEIAGGAQECDLSAFEVEGDILQRD